MPHSLTEQYINQFSHTTIFPCCILIFQ